MVEEKETNEQRQCQWVYGSTPCGRVALPHADFCVIHLNRECDVCGARQACHTNVLPYISPANTSLCEDCSKIFGE